MMFVRTGIPKSTDFSELISLSMASSIVTCFLCLVLEIVATFVTQLQVL